MNDWLIPLLVAIVGGLSTVMATRTQARSNERTANRTAAGPDWASFVKELEAHQDKVNKDFSTRINSLETELGTIRGKLETITAKYKSALVYIAMWRTRYPKEELPPPEAIVEDLLQ